MELMENNSLVINMAALSTDIAKTEKQKLNAAWYPFISLSGGYTNMSEDIAVEKSFELLNNQITISIPLLDNNIASADGNITWPLFTGGKRIYASRIGESIVRSAELLEESTKNNQKLLLIENYCTVIVLKYSVKVYEDELAANEKLYQDALSMMENGVINKAQMLVAKVARETSSLNLESTENNLDVAIKALNKMLGTDSIANNISLTSGLFICSCPEKQEYFHSMASHNNQQMQLILQQQKINENKSKIAKSGYLPDISLFSRQNIYSYNIPANLLPRRMVGAGVVWNIFDGFIREKSIKASDLEHHRLELQYDESSKELHLLIEKLYSSLENAANASTSLESSISFAKELVKARERSFQEGMATSQEVTDARALLSKARLASLSAFYQYDITLANLCALCGDTSHFISMMQQPSNLHPQQEKNF